MKAANFIINNAERTPDASEEKMRSTLAQAHFWRAYAYYCLVQTWGKGPIMLEEEINYEAQLNSVEEMYDLIIEDLKIAEAGTPIRYTDEPYGRNGVNYAASQGAVKAMMAYICMSMAGWPLNRGVEYYQLAAAKAKEVIDGSENGTYYYSLYLTKF
ncbi:MAG: RagB/SusD family nutrient uptake outer membrane protein [Tannerella sp.]|nr:RagB/SusD family nutrient uptake outer membrane protein [Tannerella sp.]